MCYCAFLQRACAGVKEMVVRSGTCLRKYILCSLWSGCKPECARSSSSSRYPLVAPASNQLLLIVKKSMGEESRCALRATSNESITACCLAFAGPALMECAQQCLLSLKRTELLFFFLKAIFCPLLVCYSATVCCSSKFKGKICFATAQTFTLLRCTQPH